jgi:hypothetical protein
VRLARAFGAALLAVARHARGPEVRIAARPSRALASRGQIIIGHEPGAAPDEHRGPVEEFEPGLGLALPIACRVITADGGTIEAVGPSVPLRLVVELPTVP